jgi:hypothetical protein
MNFSHLIITLPFSIYIFVFMTKQFANSWYKFCSCIPKSLWLTCINKQFGKCPSVLCFFYIMNVLSSLIGCKLYDMNNNKYVEG